jgi:hypothetical protein
MRRSQRSGFFQKWILSLVGVYPWKCNRCRLHRYFRHRGGWMARPPEVEIEPPKVKRRNPR